MSPVEFTGRKTGFLVCFKSEYLCNRIIFSYNQTLLSWLLLPFVGYHVVLRNSFDQFFPLLLKHWIITSRNCGADQDYYRSKDLALRDSRSATYISIESVKLASIISFDRLNPLSSFRTSQNSVRRLPTDCGYSGTQQITISMHTFQIK